MVFIYVWPPNENYIGHAALKTDKFYISFWPQDGKGIPIKGDGLVPCDVVETVEAVKAVKAMLIIHDSFDFESEGRRSPNTHDISNYVSNEVVDNQIRGFLRHNGILDPDNKATFENAKRFIEENESKNCKISLSKTRYSLLAVGSDGEIGCWYDKPQTCVSFCYNVVESARSDSGLAVIGLSTLFGVPIFEEIVKKNGLKTISFSWLM